MNDHPDPRLGKVRARLVLLCLTAMQLAGVVGLFTLVAGLAMLLAAGVACLGQGHDSGFTSVAVPFLACGLLLSGVGVLGLQLGQLHSLSQERALAWLKRTKQLDWVPLPTEENAPSQDDPSQAA